MTPQPPWRAATPTTPAAELDAESRARRRDPSYGRVRVTAALVIGAVLGALVLGAGGRLAMRGITLWEHRADLRFASGTLAVVAWGAGLGVAAGLLRVATETAFDRWAPTAAGIRGPLWGAACLALALVIVTPWTLPRLVLFPAVVLGFLVAFEAAWRRWAHRPIAAPPPGDAPA